MCTQDNYGYIYETTNLINGRKYIGMHKARRPGKVDQFYLGSGKLLKQAIEKYGAENFAVKVISWHANRTELEEAEKRTIQHYTKKGEHLYNLSQGGEGLDPRIASILMQARWDKMSPPERTEYIKPALNKQRQLREKGWQREPCQECSSGSHHRKTCSKYTEPKQCEECSGKRGAHYKTCSQFVSWVHTEKTKEKYSEVARNRAAEHNQRISNTLKQLWKDENFVEKYTCEECEGRSNNHFLHCSQYTPKSPCLECNSNPHQETCSKYSHTVFICEECSLEVSTASNFKQHINSKNCLKRQNRKL